MPKARELRARARQNLGGHIFANKWLILMLGCVLIDIISSAAAATGVLLLIITGPLTVGLANAFLKQVRLPDSPVEVDDYTVSLRGDNVARTIILGLLKTLFLFLWSLLFVIPAIVKSYAYAISEYLLLDHPEYTSTQCINESRRIMRGNKWRLFCLDLSFLGWYIVGMLCFGVGVIFVTPYHQMARAHFYEALLSGEQ